MMGNGEFAQRKRTSPRQCTLTKDKEGAHGVKQWAAALVGKMAGGASRLCPAGTRTGHARLGRWLPSVLEWLPGGDGPRTGLDWWPVTIALGRAHSMVKFPFQYLLNNSKCLKFKNAKHYLPDVQKFPKLA
jgi:hypothetical protein